MENCRGCYSGRNRCFYVSYITNTTRCPCSTCLIKVICRFMCDDYEGFAVRIHYIRFPKDEYSIVYHKAQDTGLSYALQDKE